MGLSDRALRRLDTLLEVRANIAPENHVVRRDEPFRGLLAVRSGCFKSYVIDRDGREHVKGFHLPGELMGLEGVSTGHYVTDVVALSDGSVCDLRYDSLLDISADEPCLQQQLLNLFARSIVGSTRSSGDFTAG
ncbi:MAG: cyclic nucleotide-binding domain-containing protein, partial [Pseudomonadota bacterium]